MADDETTTAAPAPAPSPDTTSAPASDSTSAPDSGDYGPPAPTTTAPPSNQFSPGTTTTAPPDSSSNAPGSTTSAAPDASTTGSSLPSIQASVQIDPDDGTVQNPNSVQVPLSAGLTLTWSASNAVSVNIEGIGDGQGVSGALPIPTQDAQFTLVAVSSDGTQSPPFVVAVWTHDDDSVVSGHATVSSGIAAILSFNASMNQQSVAHANVGDTITLTAVVSESTDSCTINGEPVGLCDAGDGNLTGSITVTLATPMTGDFDCQVSAQGAAGDPCSLHVDIGAAPETTTTGMPATTTSGMPATTTSGMPATTTSGMPATTTSGMPATTTSGMPATTTAPPTTTTAEKEKEDGQQLYQKRQTLGPDIPSYDHFTLGVNVGAEVTLFWQGSDDEKPEEMSELPGDLQGQVNDGIKTKWTSPTWDALKNGGSWKSKDYSDFWSHFKGTSGVEDEQDKEGKTESSMTVGSYEFGEVDFSPTGGNEPAFSIKLTGSLASINLKEPLATGIGVVEGQYSLTLYSFTIDSDNFRIKVEISGEIVATLIAATLEDIIKQIGKNPYAVAAAVLVLGAVVMVYMIVESPSNEELLDLRGAAQSLAKRTAASFMSGLLGNGGDDGPSQAGAQARQQYFADMRKSNPDATDDDIANTLAQRTDELTAQAEAQALPQAQDAVWNSWAPQFSGTMKEIALAPDQARLAWESIYPGVDYDNNPRFSKYFSLTDADKDDAEAKKTKDDDEAKQKLWEDWVGKNDGWTGASKEDAMAEYGRIFGSGKDWDSDPLFKKNWLD